MTGANILTFYVHVTVSTRAAGPAENVGYQLTNCGTSRPEGVGALFVGKIVPGESFELLELRSRRLQRASAVHASRSALIVCLQQNATVRAHSVNAAARLTVTPRVASYGDIL
jgi:hypothetical protein